MKTLKNYFTIIVLCTFIFTSCSKKNDDDGNQEDDLVSIGECGALFNGVDLTTLCGVSVNNIQNFGERDICAYVISNDASSSIELYISTLYGGTNVAEAKTTYNALSDSANAGVNNTVTSLSGIGNEAIYVTDSVELDIYILFRYKNITVIVGTDQAYFDLGCNNPQEALKKLSNIIIDKLQ
jgi:hypothetical protein